jgi:hypothetical protein
MEAIITRLQKDFPRLKFTPGNQFYWSPETGEISYEQDAKGR